MRQLLKTNIALTGNVRLCCQLKSVGKDIDTVYLKPLTSRNIITPYEVNLENSTYDMDLVEYYAYYKDIFYKSSIPSRFDTTGEYKSITAIDEDSNITGNISDCQYGMTREKYSINGKQFSVLAPLYIDKVNSIFDENNKFKIGIEVKNLTQDTTLRELSASSALDIFYSKLGTYLRNSFNNVNGETSSYNKDIKIYPDSYDEYGTKNCLIRGFNIESGGLVTLSSDLNINILNQAYTYTDFCEAICKEYENKRLVTPHIINLCWEFNLEDILDTTKLTTINPGDLIQVNIRYYDYDAMGTYFDMGLSDLDFNFYNMDEYETGNLIDPEFQLPKYKNNNLERLSPTISKWEMSNYTSDTKYIFNHHIYNIFSGSIPSKYNKYLTILKNLLVLKPSTANPEYTERTDEYESITRAYGWISPKIIDYTYDNENKIYKADDRDFLCVKKIFGDSTREIDEWTSGLLLYKIGSIDPSVPGTGTDIDIATSVPPFTKYEGTWFLSSRCFYTIPTIQSEIVIDEIGEEETNKIFNHHNRLTFNSPINTILKADNDTIFSDMISVLTELLKDVNNLNIDIDIYHYKTIKVEISYIKGDVIINPIDIINKLNIVFNKYLKDNSSNFTETNDEDLYIITYENETEFLTLNTMDVRKDIIAIRYYNEFYDDLTDEQKLYVDQIFPLYNDSWSRDSNTEEYEILLTLK